MMYQVVLCFCITMKKWRTRIRDINNININQLHDKNNNEMNIVKKRIEVPSAKN